MSLSGFNPPRKFRGDIGDYHLKAIRSQHIKTGKGSNYAKRCQMMLVHPSQRNFWEHVAFKAYKECHMTIQLSREARVKAISSLMLFTEKWNGSMKGQACIDKRKECKNIQKDEASSQTVTTKSISITATNKAHDKRDMAVTNPSMAF